MAFVQIITKLVMQSPRFDSPPPPLPSLRTIEALLLTFIKSEQSQ